MAPRSGLVHNLLDRWVGKLYEVVDAYRLDLIWFEVLSVTIPRTVSA